MPTVGVNVHVELGMIPLICPALVAGLMGGGMTTRSDGSTAIYYELPPESTELQHLISYKNMNAQLGEIFRACYRYGEVEHSEKLRDAKKMKFYIDAEIERLEKYEG